jgi:hypothetical protein
MQAEVRAVNCPGRASGRAIVVPVQPEGGGASPKGMKRFTLPLMLMIAAGLAIPASAAAKTTTGHVPACTASDLGVWVAIDQGNGALGTIYYPLQFTNLSQHACSLDGFPGVSVLGPDGHRLGSPADWAPTTRPHPVVLSPGATAHTLLAYHDAAVSTEAGCDPVGTAGLLSVIPPGQRTATDAIFDFESCSRPGVEYITVWGPIKPGPGTIYST